MSEDIVTKENRFLQLPASVTEIVSAMASYQDLLKKLLVDDDYAIIQNKKCIKKAGWLKLARAFNLSLKIINERKTTDTDSPSSYAYHITVSCLAGNGRIIEELGSCDNIEKPQAAEHVIRSMAITRAKSRAISSMIGASESSAEEMELVKDCAKSTHTPVEQHYLDTLKNLGYSGVQPKTSFEASKLINNLKRKVKNLDDYCTCSRFIPNSINSVFCQTCGKKKPEDDST